MPLSSYRSSAARVRPNSVSDSPASELVLTSWRKRYRAETTDRPDPMLPIPSGLSFRLSGYSIHQDPTLRYGPYGEAQMPTDQQPVILPHSLPHLPLLALFGFAVGLD
jgi:hypothetical protein